MQAWTVQLPPAGWAFSQARMQHFMRLVGSSTISFVQVSSMAAACKLWRLLVTVQSVGACMSALLVVLAQ
jgi:hypothetical protein